MPRGLVVIGGEKTHTHAGRAEGRRAKSKRKGEREGGEGGGKKKKAQGAEEEEGEEEEAGKAAAPHRRPRAAPGAQTRPRSCCKLPTM